MRPLLKVVEAYLIRCEIAIVDFLMPGKKQEEKPVPATEWKWKAFIQRVK